MTNSFLCVSDSYLRPAVTESFSMRFPDTILNRLNTSHETDLREDWRMHIPAEVKLQTQGGHAVKNPLCLRGHDIVSG